MVNCYNIIKNGMITRYIVTIITFIILAINFKNRFIINYIFLILPLLLILLDHIDNICNNLIRFYNYISNKKIVNCSRLFYYQNQDKICDSFSYLLSYLFLCLFFKVDNILFLFIVYRIIGVILFNITKNSVWLIVFFDFVKEYFIYLFIFSNNYRYIPLFILCKIYFEYYWHRIHNNSNYLLQTDLEK
jgi:hypothetical protein